MTSASSVIAPTILMALSSSVELSICKDFGYFPKITCQSNSVGGTARLFPFLCLTTVHAKYPLFLLLLQSNIKSITKRSYRLSYFCVTNPKYINLKRPWFYHFNSNHYIKYCSALFTHIMFFCFFLQLENPTSVLTVGGVTSSVALSRSTRSDVTTTSSAWGCRTAATQVGVGASRGARLASTQI